MRKLLIFLLLLPIVFSSKVMVYSSNIDMSCYKNININNLRDFLQASGYTVEFGNNINISKMDESMYDAVIMLSCTRDLSDEEANDLLLFVELGGGLIIDAHQGNNRLLNKLNISRGIPLSGNAGEYTTSFGKISGSKITYWEQNEMTFRGENLLLYNGNTIMFPSNFKPLFWNVIPSEVVAGYSKFGEGRILLSGSLFSFNDNLFLDIIDWTLKAEPFPKLEITRKLSKNSLNIGETLIETITISLSGGKATFDVYEEIPSEYGITLTQMESSMQDLTNLKYIQNQWNATKEINGSVTIPPIKVTAHQGAKMRIFYSSPVNITINSGAVVMPAKENEIPIYLLVMPVGLILIAVFLIIKRKSFKKQAEKDEIVKEKERIEKQLKLAKIQFMKREITQEMYNDMVKDMQQKLIELNVKLAEKDNK